MGKIAIACCALLLGVPAAAADPPPARWNVDWGDRHCTLIRLVEQGPVLAIRTIPGSMKWELRVVSQAWPEGRLAEAQRMTVALEPGGVIEAPQVGSERTPAGQALVLYGLPMGFPETLASARSVRLAAAGDPPIDISLTGTSQAIAALRECERDVMRQWGIDPTAAARLRSPPRGDLAQFVQHWDYPAEALRRSMSGTTIVRLTIGTDGLVADCTVVASSGHALLDRTTCRVLQRRARLTPAVDADGHPTVAQLIAGLTWSVSG